MGDALEAEQARPGWGHRSGSLQSNEDSVHRSLRAQPGAGAALQPIRHLTSLGHEVTVVTVWTNEQERAEVDELRKHSFAVEATHMPRWRSLWNCVRALPTRQPMQAVFSWHPGLMRRTGAGSWRA